MADLHDNRATVTVGGREYAIVASNRAMVFYGDRFRSDVDALGQSHTTSYHDIEDSGKTIRVPYLVRYTGNLKHDTLISSAAPMDYAGDIPVQVIAATWAMARAAGSTDASWDEFEIDWLESTSVADENFRLWEVVCVDLLNRAFFRDGGRPTDAGEPDEDEQA